MRLILGVTGNIASGKSQVARYFQEKGCALVDADKVTHELYANNTGLMQQLAAEFGAEILHPNGTLNRRLLGAQVFGNPNALAELDRIVHPHLLVAIRERVFSALKVMNRVVLDAALIVEWEMQRELDCLVLVTAQEPLRLERLMERDGLSHDEAMIRIHSQMPEAEKRPFADFEIANDDGPEELIPKVDAVWEAIEAKFAGMNKPIWLLAIVGVILGIAIGLLQNHNSGDPLDKLFPEEKLKGAVPDVRVSIIGNLTTKSITGGEVILAQAVVPRHVNASEISPTALNALRGILRQSKADWICLYIAEDSTLALTSNWVAMAEYHRGKISITGGLLSQSQIDSLKSSGLSVVRPDSVQTRQVLEVFDSLGLKSDRWKLSQTLRGASAVSLNREEFFKLELDTRVLSDIGKKHGMTGDQIRALVLGVTRYYWLKAGKPLAF